LSKYFGASVPEGATSVTEQDASMEIMKAFGEMAQRPGYDPAQNHAFECLDIHRLLWPEETPLEPYPS
jgi:hypothetical protein